jgi:hypothetical protein
MERNLIVCVDSHAHLSTIHNCNYSLLVAPFGGTMISMTESTTRTITQGRMPEMNGRKFALEVDCLLKQTVALVQQELIGMNSASAVNS